jgi:hypothetical protein
MTAAFSRLIETRNYIVLCHLANLNVPIYNFMKQNTILRHLFGANYAKFVCLSLAARFQANRYTFRALIIYDAEGTCSINEETTKCL